MLTERQVCDRREADTSPPIEANDRRSDHRYRTIFRVAKVATGCDLGLWRIRNISDRGMMLLTHVEVGAGERLSVALSDKVSVEGRVVWSGDGRCGLAFDEPIDCAAVLRDLVADQRSSEYRPPRLPVSARALAYDETGIHPVKIRDLSQHGIGFEHHGQFRAGMKVLLVLENGIERRGVVRWASDDRAGLLLIEPFACEELESAGELGCDTEAA
jgi:hypothetical protein